MRQVGEPHVAVNPGSHRNGSLHLGDRRIEVPSLVRVHLRDVSFTFKSDYGVYGKLADYFGRGQIEASGAGVSVDLRLSDFAAPADAQQSLASVNVDRFAFKDIADARKPVLKPSRGARKSYTDSPDAQFGGYINPQRGVAEGARKGLIACLETEVAGNMARDVVVDRLKANLNERLKSLFETLRWLLELVGGRYEPCRKRDHADGGEDDDEGRDSPRPGKRARHNTEGGGAAAAGAIVQA